MSGKSGIINVSGGSGIPAIQVVQNCYSTLGFTQDLERDGSEWTRDVEHDLSIDQSFSDFFHVEVETVMSLSSSNNPDALLNFDVESTLVLTQVVTVAGGRIEGGGGSGDTTNTFTLTYDSAGASAVIGMVVYIDGDDNEAKLATYNDDLELAEVAGFLTEDVDAGESVTIQTEGEILRDNWTDVAGTANLLPGAMYYLHTGGQMRVSPPETGHIVIVGRAITPTAFDAEINPPWVA